ncbi:hypothetical protein GWN43_06595 [Candidatus Bathyarchaeota archaeon]|nr:hypothetical protein [Candidatus Bathyarchaeota archaeon]
MQEIPQELQELYKTLKASKVGRYIVGINGRDQVLSIRNVWGDERDDLIMHITLDEQLGRFNYYALGNKDANNPERYLTIEEKEGVSSNTIVEVTTRLLMP